MKSIVFCLGSLREPRVHAILRRDFPLLYVVPWLLMGQLCGALGWIWPALWGVALALWLKRGSFLRSVVIIWMLGVTSVAFRHSDAPPRLPALSEVVQIEVLSVPRHPRVGEMRFEALVVPRGKGEWKSFKALCTAVDLPWRNVSALSLGASALLVAHFRPVRESFWPFSYQETLRRGGIQAQCTVKLVKVLKLPNPGVREVILDRAVKEVTDTLGEGETSGLILSMGLGIRDVLSERTEMAFKTTGLAHLLVVSGYQVTLVFGSVFWVLSCFAKLVPISKYQGWRTVVAGWLAFGFTALFVFAIGFEGSTLRAGLALLFCLIARQFERRGGMLNGILASLTVISILWPGAIFEPGVELTYAALCGIALGARLGGARLLVLLEVTFFATTATAVVSLCWFGTLSLIGFLLNPFLAPGLGFISCDGGFVAIAAQFAGLDPGGVMLKWVAETLVLGRDSVIRASYLRWASIEPQGIQFGAVLLTLILTLAARWISKFNQYVISSGLD